MKSEKKYINAIYGVLLVYGLIAITSLNFKISNELMLINYFFIYIVFINFIIKVKKINKINLIFSIIIMFFLLLSTLTSKFYNYTWGTLLPYLTFTLMIILDIKKLKLKYIDKYFLIFNSINLIIGFLIIISNKEIINFIAKYYSWGYEELVTNMLLRGKPILWFGSHSLTGLFIFIFYYLCIRTYMIKNKNIYLLFSLGYLVLLISLKSNTSLVFFIIAIVYLIRQIKDKKIMIIIFIGLIILLLNNSIIRDIYNESFVYITNSDKNGIIGRFGAGGALESTLKYIKSNFFNPIGLSYSSELYYTDNGFVINILRGGIIFTISIYVSFYLFLKRNIKFKSAVYVIFISILMFEIGYVTFLYFRTFYIVVFVILYLNYLYDESTINNEERII